LSGGAAGDLFCRRHGDGVAGSDEDSRCLARFAGALLL
jgi:hypothetical protein